MKIDLKYFEDLVSLHPQKKLYLMQGQLESQNLGFADGKTTLRIKLAGTVADKQKLLIEALGNMPEFDSQSLSFLYSVASQDERVIEARLWDLAEAIVESVLVLEACEGMKAAEAVLNEIEAKYGKITVEDVSKRLQDRQKLIVA